VKSKIWELAERIKEIERDNKKCVKEMKNLTMVFAAFVAVISIVAFLFDRPTLDYGFTLVGTGLMFVLVRINQQINLSESNAEIKGIKLAIIQLDALLFEFKMYHMPDMGAYMQAYEKRRYSSENLSDEDNYVLSEFNVERNLAIADSMGYSQPTFWD
jgi:hypothetical protein